ncbi:hypothetical protein PybrP1_006676, partial [[Pythium] brassicae (nom. inval.)]
MVVVNSIGAKSTAIINSELDAVLGATRISLLGNYIHHTSGHEPKITSARNAVFAHSANNHRTDSTGSLFDVSDKGVVTIEGNYFKSTATSSMK